MYFFQFFYKFNNLDIYLQIPIFVILIILLVSTIYDLKLGIVPDYLSKLLILFGIIYHIIISLIYSNYYFLINSIISGILIFILSFILWIIRFWGGGDLKIFTGMAISLSYISFPISSLNYMSFKIQHFIYLPIISILFNAILISFPLILIFLFEKSIRENYKIYYEYLYKNLKSNNIKFYNKLGMYLKIFKLILFNIKKLLIESSKKELSILDLKEGMILNKYYFDNKEIFKFFKNLEINSCKTNLEISELNNINLDNLNLSVIDISDKYQSNLFYIKSANGGGLTSEDILIIDYLLKEKYFKNPNFMINQGIPFIPFLTLGYIIFILYGDLISIISYTLFSFI